MDGGNKVIGLWRGREGIHPTQASAPGEAPPFIEFEAEDETPPGRWRRRVAVGACLIAALGWIGAVGYSRYLSWAGRAPALDDIIGLITTLSAPLAVIALLWLIGLRSSKSEADRFARTAHALRVESERMDTVLAFVSARIDASRRELTDQGDALLNLGEDAASRMNGITDALRKEIETLSGNAQALKGTAAAARGDLAVLLSHLPKAQVQMRQIASSLLEAGNTAQERAAGLTNQMASLGTTSADVGARVEVIARDFASQLNDINSKSVNLAQLITDSEHRLSAAGEGKVEQLAARIQEISLDVDRISQGFSSHDEASRSLATRVNADLGDLEARFAAFDAHGRERTDQLSDALGGLQSHAEALHGALSAGDADVVGLTGKADALLTALDAAAREIDETLPAAYGRLETAAERAMGVVGQAAPAVTDMATASQNALEQLTSAESLIAGQNEALASMSTQSAAALAACRAEIESLEQALASAGTELQSLTDGAGGALLDSLMRARDTARQAAEHAREAFNEVIPQTAASFGEQSKQALGDALTAQVEAQMKEIAATTERAVGTAQKATDRLMRQMLTISETSAALEARIAEAKDEAERSDHSTFARRVALLIESLNSSAIDVTKILSNDVTDTAWAAYLRGDRGVFARRAVKLLDASETKEIARHYQDNSDFREQVNRYIHDYEAMLRSVMSTRDGTPLSVALLSSDTGKLYVALAQGIERLRA